MDKVIVKKSKKNQFIIWGMIAAFVVVAGLYFLGAQDSGAKYRVERESLKIATVVNQSFDDYIPVRGIVEPKQTVFLDTIIGGQVEQVYAEEGEVVSRGKPLLKLRNAAIELDIISREAQVSEQLNNLRNTRLSLEQDKLNLKREVLDIRYRIKNLKRQLDKFDSLKTQKLVSEEEFDSLYYEHEYYTGRLALALERQEKNAVLYESQLQQLQESSTHLNKNLTLAKKNIDNLEIKAPVDGYLTSLNVEIGEYVSPGVRLGQVDSTNQFKVRARIDEFYVTRISMGLVATYTQNGRDYSLTIDKVYPQVADGQFEVDFLFTDKVPENIRRGQGLQLKVFLGESEKRLLLSRGGFFATSGGEWVFVLNEDGTQAVKRSIKLGRRNPKFFEVIDGLAENDKVVISNYDNLQDIDQLIIN
ncbi:efflux RND transporter periplasmic adaptor subunit [Pseudoalteromonas luteoviolacea]|uniref:efflux RND transporter periplasmic adaptor subunit n=1 Tax=Pseudoalteromonas luteoviolacea TaxID=43657 RepID=UPI001EED7387|nr:efflux RND transporter periplasmic adaptor subunit [Pseudoalteromonas luteoviolacea]MCF6437900.1 efflux RND transporter periplasmic adaptor subunit [Pseudoalteromonas luteoviolacea]